MKMTVYTNQKFSSREEMEARDVQKFKLAENAAIINYQRMCERSR